jgi:hypothetical protein
MARETQLDRQWASLMSLCTKERDFKSNDLHPRLLRLVTGQIDELAAKMGFSPSQIATREFRAEKDGARILKLLTD